MFGTTSNFCIPGCFIDYSYSFSKAYLILISSFSQLAISTYANIQLTLSLVHNTTQGLHLCLSIKINLTRTLTWLLKSSCLDVLSASHVRIEIKSIFALLQYIFALHCPCINIVNKALSETGLNLGRHVYLASY